MSKQLFEVSKFLSYVLRDQPDTIGITLDLEAWTEISALIAAAANSGRQLDRDLILAVVATSDKKRFAISEDGLRIRAVQGHSTKSVDLTSSPGRKGIPTALRDDLRSRFGGFLLHRAA